MKNKKHRDNFSRLQNILKIDKEKVEKTTQESKENINIIDDCKSFCSQYSNIDFNLLEIPELKEIRESGTGLLNTFIITNQEVNDNTIIQLQHIIMNANYILSVKQIENSRQKILETRKEVYKIMKNATKIEKETKKTSKQLKVVRNDVKSVITTIISIILTISIIPTAVAGIDKVDPNYILPFLSSIILFGMIMIILTYSIYQEKLKASTWIILIIGIIICIAFWIMSFKIDIGKIIQTNKEYEDTSQNIINQIESID